MGKLIASKWVGSATLSGELEWNATLLEGNLEDSIPKLKESVDGDPFMHGSGEFAHALAERALVRRFDSGVVLLTYRPRH